MASARFFKGIAVGSAYIGIFSNVAWRCSPRLTPEMALFVSNIFGLNATTFYYDDEAGQVGHLLALTMHAISVLMLCEEGVSPAASFIVVPALLSLMSSVLYKLSDSDSAWIEAHSPASARP